MRFWDRVSFENCTAAALGITVFVFALGSSSVESLHHPAASVKWVALGMMLPLGGALALRQPRPRRPAPSLYVLAALLLFLAFESASWSVDPRRTWEYAASLALLFAVAGSLGVAATNPAVARALITGVLGGAVAVAIGGLVVLAVNHGLAVEPATPGTPARFRGLTENPNTVSLLAALVLPLSLWKAVTLRAFSHRVAAGLLLLLLFWSIVASGSKGALGAALIGTGAFALTFDQRYRRRLALACAVAIAISAGVAIDNASLTPAGSTAPISQGSIPVEPGTPGPGKSGSKGGSSRPTGTSQPVSPSVKPGGNVPTRLTDEIGAPQTNAAPPRRTLFGTSGRSLAWRGAISIGAERPIAGYGFGTEELAFVDRWYAFQGDRPENSFIGIFLQLGLVGLALLISIGLVLILVTRRALGSSNDRALVAACFGVFAGGATLAIAQSYVYAVGNIGALAFWSGAFVLAGLSGAAARGRA